MSSAIFRFPLKVICQSVSDNANYFQYGGAAESAWCSADGHIANDRAHTHRMV